MVIRLFTHQQEDNLKHSTLYTLAGYKDLEEQK